MAFPEDLLEAALVVIVSVAGGIVFAADVDDGVAGGEERGVAGADEGRGGIAWEEAEEEDGEGFVGVEVAAVGAYEGAVQAGALGG